MRKQTLVWRAEDGRRIRLCDLSDPHLLNIIFMLERHALWYQLNPEKFYYKGGLTATSSDIRIMQATFHKFWKKYYSALRAEVERRGFVNEEFAIFANKTLEEKRKDAEYAKLMRDSKRPKFQGLITW